ncbi:hypothetical protein ACJ7Z2_07795 [Mannheimia glucosida]|uniref:hypothetical protein n=1 Tax=Mannheimia glucosida TaxID=85401 RepID=UPI00391861BA
MIKSYDQAIRQAWQVTNLLEILSKSDFQGMDGLEISEAIGGIHSLLVEAVTIIEEKKP